MEDGAEIRFRSWDRDSVVLRYRIIASAPRRFDLYLLHPGQMKGINTVRFDT